jgi:hypothetical protein
VTPMCPSLSVPIGQEQRGFLYRYFSFSTVSVKRSWAWDNTAGPGESENAQTTVVCRS